MAVLHRVGGTIRGLIGTLARAGVPAAPGDLKPAVTAWQEFPADRPQQVSDWLQENDVGAVVVVLPAAAVVCRTCTLPDADPEHLARALALQAEAHLLAGVPSYRRAMAVLPAAAGEMSRSGIIVDWPQGPADRDLTGAADENEKPWGNRSVTFAPDVGAVGALLNGHRPDEPLLWYDRADGSLALAISHANGAILRAARVSPDRTIGWADNVGRVVAETALSVGHTPAFTETLVHTINDRITDLDRNAALVAPNQAFTSVQERVDGTPQERHWWRDYGVALGALLAASGQLAPLTRLQLAPPAESPSAARRLVDVLSNPVAAFRIAAVCVLLILLGPLIFSGLRLALLKVKLPDLQTYRAEARQAEVQLAMYGELEGKAWPMTKLLADVACCTPQGIDLDQIRIGDDRIRVSGRAKPDDDSNLSAQQVVTLMQQNLRDSNIFDEIYLTWGDPNTFGAYEFTLSAKVVNPYLRHDYPVDLDYGAWTLADRMYGGPRPDPKTPEPKVLPANQTDPGPGPNDDASADPVPADGAVEAPRTGIPRNGRDPGIVPLPGEGHRAGPDDLPRRGTDRTPGGPLPPSKAVPEPLTQEQVDAMNLTEAQETFAQISAALKRAQVDDDTKERLWRDWRMVRDRV
ncbi:MAG: PilN domain-containing protein, partial [Planctomycetota bacterium]